MIQQEKKEESIKRILDAATEIFAESGFEGARVDEIAKRAGVNKAMIYYRVGDKEALYSTVLHNLFGNIANRISRDIHEDQSPEDKLKTYIKNFIENMELHPYLPFMMMREITSGGKHFTETVARDLMSILLTLKKILREGIEKKYFIDTDPLVIHMMIVAPLVFFRASDSLRQRFLPVAGDLIDYAVTQDIRNVSREVSNLVIRAIKK